MLIGILETGRPDPVLAEEFGTFADMVTNLLADGNNMQFRRFWLLEDDFPPSIKACDAWVITGSYSSVTEERPWMLRLEGLLRDAEATRRPVIGICFGHQILAKALGGEVKAAPNGWQLGLTDYELIERPAWLEDAQDCFRLNAIHQDQVLRAPPGSSLLARATGCPIAALTYGNWAVSFQAHPEFTVPFEKILLTRLAGQILPDKLSCFALSALNQPNVNTDAVALAKGLQRFLRRR